MDIIIVLLKKYDRRVEMKDKYINGDYLNSTKSWHAEDSSWKASNILKIIKRNKIECNSIVEVGCGVGSILYELSKSKLLPKITFSGYDISPQAIEIANKIPSDKIKFYCDDITLEKYQNLYFDVLLMIDVFEHIPNYMQFIDNTQTKAKYKVYHIPLDLHVSSVLRASFIKNRDTIGHIHYFTEESAIALLKDSGLEVIDYFLTDTAIDLYALHPSFSRLIANIPRRFFSLFSKSLSARLFGGYSLIVLAK